MRAPSQCPGPARSSTSAGRLLVRISGQTTAWPRPRRRALGTRSACPVRRQAVSSRRRAPRPWMDSAWETASCEILIETSSGYALRRRWAICCGLHDVAPCRSRRRPGRRTRPGAHVWARHVPPVLSPDRACEAVLHGAPQAIGRGQLGSLRPLGTSGAVPRRSRRPIRQTAASSRRVATPCS